MAVRRRELPDRRGESRRGDRPHALPSDETQASPERSTPGDVVRGGPVVEPTPPARRDDSPVVDRFREIETQAVPTNGRVLLEGTIQGIRHFDREEFSGCLLAVSPFLARRRKPVTDFYVQLPGGQTCSVRCDGEIGGFLAESNIVQVQGLMRNGAIGARTVVNLSSTPPALVFERSACFIASAACGACSVEVRRLVWFRDDVLRRTAAGRMFILCYEIISPPLARWVASRPGIRAVVRRFMIRPASDWVARRWIGGAR